MSPRAAPTEGICPSQRGEAADLAWLLHRTAQCFRSALDSVTAAHGLDVREFVVLTSLATGTPGTQAALGLRLGLDKTTLTSLLDRLEGAGLVSRRIDPANRRARFPEVTEAGRALQITLARERVAVETSLLASLDGQEAEQLRAVLRRLLAAHDGVQTSGSCM